MSLTVLDVRGMPSSSPSGLSEMVDEPRILGQAVAADAHARPQDVDIVGALRHRVGRVNDLQHVHVQPVAHLGQFVGHRDIEVDPEVVGKLDHLGGSRVLDDDGVHAQGVPPQRGAGAGAALIDGADDDGNRRQLADGLALGEPLGAKRQPEVDSGPQPRGLFKDRPNNLFGGVGWHRALEDDEVAAMQVLPHGPRRRLDVVDDGLVVRTERRADGDDDEVIVRDGAEIGGGAKPTDSYVVAHEFTKPRLGHGGLAQVDLVDDVLSHVDPRHGPAAIGQHGTDHGADVAEAHHGDA